jgi:hypothetical protein
VAQVSDEIRFTVSRTGLTVSNKNTAYTSFMDLVFQVPFFRSFEFNTDTFCEGLSELDGEVIYSFSVRAKLLSMLFKKHEDDVETFKISLDASDSCSLSLRYRLQIEMYTKRFIRKKFLPFYTPCSPETQKLSNYYKGTFFDQKQDPTTPITVSFLMIDVGTLRMFLDNAGSTDQFKMEITRNEFSVTAFTRGISIKEKEILKQPMAVNMRFNTHELQDLMINDDDENNKVVFRLKEFKTFLNLGLHGEPVECWFKNGGDPILFEINKNNVTIRMILDTDNDVNIPLPESNRFRRSRAKAQKQPIALDVDVNVALDENGMHLEHDKEPLFVPNDANESFEDRMNDIPDVPDDETDNLDQETLQSDPGQMGLIPLEPGSDSDARVTWGDPMTESLTLQNLVNARNQVIEDAKVQYMESLKRRKLDEQKQASPESQAVGLGPTQREDQFGPTQNVDKTKGIFDG